MAENPEDEDLSTRVDGAGPAVILITAKAILAAGEAYLTLTVTNRSIAADSS
jgi:hypothetical protein